MAGARHKPSSHSGAGPHIIKTNNYGNKTHRELLIVNGHSHVTTCGVQGDVVCGAGEPRQGDGEGEGNPGTQD